MDCHIAGMSVEPCLAPSLVDRHWLSGQRQSRGRTERHHDPRMNELQLLHQPPTIMLYLARGRFLMQSPLTALYKFEMFYGVGQVDLAPVDPDLLESAIEQLPGGSNKGTA